MATNLKARVEAREHGALVEISVACDPTPLAGARREMWSCRVHVRASRGAEVREGFGGGGSLLCEEPLSETWPTAVTPWIPGDGRTLQVEVALSVTFLENVGRPKRRHHFRGACRVRAGGQADLDLEPCRGLEGPVFAEGMSDALAAEVPREPPRREVIVPGQGLLQHRDDFDARGTRLELTTLAGERKEVILPGNRAVIPGEKEPRDWKVGWMRASAAGWIAASREVPFRARQLVAFRLDGGQVHAISSKAVDAWFDETGRYLWHAELSPDDEDEEDEDEDGGQIGIWNLDTGKYAARSFGDLSERWLYDPGALLHVREDRIYDDLDDGLVTRSFGSGRRLSRIAVPRCPDVSGALSIAARRIAWARPLSLGDGAVSGVRWHDLDTMAGGDVVVPDKLTGATVLEDGRILARGRHAWLIAPPGPKPVCIVEDAGLGAEPLAARDAEGWSLWASREGAPVRVAL